MKKDRPRFFIPHDDPDLIYPGRFDASQDDPDLVYPGRFGCRRFLVRFWILVVVLTTIIVFAWYCLN